MKRILSAVLLLSLAFGIASTTALALGTDLGQATVTACVQEGRGYDAIGRLVDTLAPPVRFNEPGVTDRVQVLTVKTELRLIGFQAEQNGQDPAAAVAQVVSNPMLTVLIYAQGSDPQLAADVGIALVQNNKTIEPDVLINPQNSDMDTSSGSIVYGKVIVAQFAYSALDPGAKAQLVYNRDDRELVYDLDLPGLD